jgi:hypothetical protein
MITSVRTGQRLLGSEPVHGNRLGFDEVPNLLNDTSYKGHLELTVQTMVAEPGVLGLIADLPLQSTNSDARC